MKRLVNSNSRGERKHEAGRGGDQTGSQVVIDLMEDSDGALPTQTLIASGYRVVVDLTIENHPHGFWYIDLTSNDA